MINNSTSLFRILFLSYSSFSYLYRMKLYRTSVGYMLINHENKIYDFIDNSKSKDGIPTYMVIGCGMVMLEFV